MKTLFIFVGLFTFSKSPSPKEILWFDTLRHVRVRTTASLLDEVLLQACSFLISCHCQNKLSFVAFNETSLDFFVAHIQSTVAGAQEGQSKGMRGSVGMRVGLTVCVGMMRSMMDRESCGKKLFFSIFI